MKGSLIFIFILSLLSVSCGQSSSKNRGQQENEDNAHTSSHGLQAEVACSAQDSDVCASADNDGKILIRGYFIPEGEDCQNISDDQIIAFSEAKADCNPAFCKGILTDWKSNQSKIDLLKDEMTYTLCTMFDTDDSGDTKAKSGDVLCSSSVAVDERKSGVYRDNAGCFDI